MFHPPECGIKLIWTRVGHAYAEYAVHADYVHMREYADADENLIHIMHIWVSFCRTGKMVALCPFFLKSRASV